MLSPLSQNCSLSLSTLKTALNPLKPSTLSPAPDDFSPQASVKWLHLQLSYTILQVHYTLHCSMIISYYIITEVDMYVKELFYIS